MQNLVYSVYPLAESMYDYVWNFDVLNVSDEEVYI